MRSAKHRGTFLENLLQSALDRRLMRQFTIIWSEAQSQEQALRAICGPKSNSKSLEYIKMPVYQLRLTPDTFDLLYFKRTRVCFLRWPGSFVQVWIQKRILTKQLDRNPVFFKVVSVHFWANSGVVFLCCEYRSASIQTNYSKCTCFFFNFTSHICWGLW